jgi:Tol biopolymer transport system component
LEVRNVVTGEARTHAEQLRPDKPSWFPDGRSLLVPGWVRGQPETGQALYQIDVTTGSVTTLLEFPPEPSWSLIAIGGIVHADPDYLIYVHGGTLRRHHLPSGHDEVLFTDLGLALRSLALSPSGSELAFAVNDSTDAARPHPMVELYNAGQLMVVSLDSGEVRKLARITEPGIISSLEWTPDGAQLLFLQTGSERSVLWRVSREGGEAEPVWESERRVTNFSLAPDGGRATYTTIHVDNEIWVMENLRSVLER